ncbi:MAG: glutamate--tRNA ligase [Chlamydiae bacterium]|nr:glutamate--tRNA ligase [Chlamydiota bacterium]MBI3266251.1 glutamate--tRNA ligase [Chlamydiota bacterium]
MTASEKVRVRFAPSPTGFLHIGGARTALFNWLFARHAGGIFQLRIEDTDPVRSEDRFRDEILESLKWFGLDWDEGPIYQSSRFDLYRSLAQDLVKKDMAFEKEGAVVFQIPPEKVELDDLVYGKLEFDNSLLNELVILKSDGTPTYNFACVVDDATLNVTHVIRGDDHLSNTPKQLALYEALGFKRPHFAHVPMILGSDGERLSKRHGATALLQYCEAGFLPEALMNFLALLGWSPGGDLELMSREDLIRLFSLDRVNRKSAIFDVEKLTWMNGQYIRQADSQRLKKDLVPFVQAQFGKVPSEESLEPLVALFKERIKTLADFPREACYFFQDSIEPDPQAVQKYLSTPESRERLKILLEELKGLGGFNEAALEPCIRNLATRLGVKAGDLIHPVRVALTGKQVSPGIFQMMSLLGRERVLKRLEDMLDR